MSAGETVPSPTRPKGKTMWNKKRYVRVGLLCKCRPPRGQAWCSCKFQKLRYTIIRIACGLIETLECKCEAPKWTNEQREHWLRQHGFIEAQLTDEEREAQYQRDLNDILDEQLRDQI